MMGDLTLADLKPETDRAMLCGSPHMLSDFRQSLDARDFHPAPRIGYPGQYIFERAFVEKLQEEKCRKNSAQEGNYVWYFYWP